MITKKKYKKLLSETKTDLSKTDKRILRKGIKMSEIDRLFKTVAEVKAESIRRGVKFKKWVLKFQDWLG